MGVYDAWSNLFSDKIFNLRNIQLIGQRNLQLPTYMHVFTREGRRTYLHYFTSSVDLILGSDLLEYECPSFELAFLQWKCLNKIPFCI